MKRWSLLFHGFTALFVLSYPAKAVYFLYADYPEFAIRRYPRLDDLPEYVGISLLCAAAFFAVMSVTYNAVAHRQRGNQTERSPVGLVTLGVLACGGLLAEHATRVIEKISEGTILYRNAQLTSEAFEDGTLGLLGLLTQVEIGLAVCLCAYAIQRRRPFLVFLSACAFFVFFVVSDGSRFALLSSVGFLPLTFYIVRWRKAEHYRALVWGIYLAAAALPLLMGPLQIIRATGDMPMHDRANDELLRGGLVTFDSLDHLVNYVYRWPIDWTGGRALEEFLYFLPRALYPEKPFLYASNGLQEVLYGTFGGEWRHHLYGMYPLGCVVLGLDMIGPIGLILHAIATGAALALADNCINGKLSPVRCGLFVFNLFYVYHVIRGGMLHYAIGAVGTCGVPLALVAIDRTFFARRLVPRDDGLQLASNRPPVGSSR